MAKTAKPSAPENPVAGQTGYRLDSEDPDRVMVETRSIEPERVAAKQQRKAPTIPTIEAKEATGQQLYDWLIGPESGTNPDKLADAREWLRRKPDATAEQFLHQLEAPDEGCLDIQEGTIRKAGKWVFGPTWEVESAVLQSPNDEIARLRIQAANLEDQVKQAVSAKVSLEARIKYLTDRNNQLAGQVDYLKSGRTQQELHMLGIQQTESNLATAGR